MTLTCWPNRGSLNYAQVFESRMRYQLSCNDLAALHARCLTREVATKWLRSVVDD